MKKKLSCNLNPWRKYFNPKEQLLLLSILITGLNLRIINAFRTQLWLDEVSIFFSSRDNSFLNLLLQNHWDKLHPPLYFIILHFWQRIAIAPFFLRLPSLIASLLILALIPILAKKLFPKQKYFPFLALFFYSFSHTQISLNMVVRPYPFVILFIIISMILFASIVKSDNLSFKTLLFFALANFLVFFTDYSGVWLLVSYALFYLFYSLFFYKEKSSLKQGLFDSLVLTDIFVLLWSPIFARNLAYSLSFEAILIEPFFKEVNPITANFWQLPFFSGITMDDILIRFEMIDYVGWAFLIIFTGLAGLVLSFFKKPKSGLFLLTAFLFPIIFSFLFSVFFIPIFIARNLFIFNLMLIFGLAYLFSILLERNHLLVLVILLFWIINFSFAFPMLHYVDPPYDWKGLTKTLSNYNQEQKKYLITDEPAYMFAPLKYYTQFQPVKNIHFISLSQVNSLKNQTGKIIFLKPSYLKYPKLNEYPKYYKEAHSFGCLLKQRRINYFYFFECEKK